MRGFIVWFTGLSGTGKSTLASALAARLARPIEVLDGDQIRLGLSADLGFTKQDRDTNIRRIGFVARLLAKHRIGVVTATISPYAATRGEMRALAEAQAIPFLEVFATARLESLVARDTKGLYQRALVGELERFTGVSDPYEPPTAPDVVVETDRETVDESLAKIMVALQSRDLIGAA